MNASDLYALGERFNQNRTLLCFNGPISRSLIEEIGNALKNYLNVEHARPAEAMDVFSVYIEMIQNIRQYAAQNGDTDACATVVIGRRDESRYVVSAGNLVRIEDGNALVARVQELAALDKAAYKAQLHKPRAQGVASGAGLGLIDIARRSGAPMEASLTPAAGEGTAFFSLSAVI
ncbi:biofilm regulation protein kinase SiaB [Achromobacter sp. Marseille-Q0513]|uniref:biofilm regulation protein kinase SiaB n=1 Tax=Achromobacter sp. Marseille-Q0513 TaxID=2829161 RepID=UPI001B91C1ED|nr:biofilm regulation protein kinase SiaB [Achromobacter sp. Marseille-Q0513]MBR8654665.1 biofilm regulation protein kinase SiaB [Achromobacter sp. Marseille-Q0513]